MIADLIKSLLDAFRDGNQLATAQRELVADLQRRGYQMTPAIDVPPLRRRPGAPERAVAWAARIPSTPPVTLFGQQGRPELIVAWRSATIVPGHLVIHPLDGHLVLVDRQAIKIKPRELPPPDTDRVRVFVDRVESLELLSRTRIVEAFARSSWERPMMACHYVGGVAYLVYGLPFDIERALLHVHEIESALIGT